MKAMMKAGSVLLPLTAAVLLAACGGGDNPGGPIKYPPQGTPPNQPVATNTINLKVAKGAVDKADCELTRIGSTTVIAERVTSVAGTATFKTTDGQTPDGNYQITCKPTATSTYYDEATKTRKPYNFTLTAVFKLDAPAENVVISAASTAIVDVINRRIAASQPVKDADITAAKDFVSKLYGGINPDADIMLVDSDADLTALMNANPNDPAVRQGLAAAAMSYLAQSLGKTPAEILAAISADIADGVLGDDLAGIGIPNLAALQTQVTNALDAATNQTPPTSNPDSNVPVDPTPTGSTGGTNP